MRCQEVVELVEGCGVSMCSRHGSTIVGPTIFMMSTGLVKWAPKAWRSFFPRRRR